MQAYKAVDFDQKEKLYVLVEFPYPSGSGLHVGHAFSFTGADVYARFQRAQGKNVLFPIGWDAFGLPTENYAIRTGRKPQEVTKENTDTFRRQMKKLGLSFDYDREVNTTDPGYYKWTQWIFIKLFEKGLAYKQEMPINWCPSCKVGLANEEVIDGRCERCHAETTRRRISQWVVRITAYADRLISGLEGTQFIDKVRAAQVNWIGRSEGAHIRFPIQGRDASLEVFTTRPDTLWGATFMVIAPEHLLVEGLMGSPEIAAYVNEARRKSDLERQELVKDKTGVFSGLMATNPATGELIPVWISDFVLMSYGTGAIMSVPGHDERDHAFAKKFGLEIRPVIQPEEDWDFSTAAYSQLKGKMINSGPINGVNADEAISMAVRWLEDQQLGKGAVSYHLRDWIFSRQHYWGEPIPMIHCEKCGWSPVPEDQLPVVLPAVERYEPTDTGESPLANIREWVEVSCPQCGGHARRETDTMPNWAGSDWYFMRYTDPHNDAALADPQKLKYWMPVDVYIGGDEHNTLHLLYSRFIYQFLHDLGAVPAEIAEPYKKRLSHGVILGTDNQRMSKSRGNVITPDEIVDQYGADVTRTYMMFMGPFDATMAWSERTLMGVKRFMDRYEKLITDNLNEKGGSDPKTKSVVNRLVKQVEDDCKAFKFNTAVAKMMEAVNTITESSYSLGRDDVKKLLQVIAPFAPFMAEKYWTVLELPGSVHNTLWPKVDESLLAAETIQIPVQVNGKLRATLTVQPDITQDELVALAQEMESVAKYLTQGSIRKVIYVPKRTLNFVVG